MCGLLWAKANEAPGKKKNSSPELLLRIIIQKHDREAEVLLQRPTSLPSPLLVIVIVALQTRAEQPCVQLLGCSYTCSPSFAFKLGLNSPSPSGIQAPQHMAQDVL